jgi:hypothetical protein
MAMAKPFGSTPGDRDLASIGVGAGAVLLGALVPNLLSIAGGVETRSVWPVPGWLAAVLAMGALLLAFKVRIWPLRIGLAAFAASQLNAFTDLSLGPRLTTGLGAVFAASIVLAAWPHSDRRARMLAIALFTSALATRMWILTRWS